MDADAPPSKSRRKREMHELQALGEALVELPAAQLDQFELPDRLRAAIDEARRMTKRGALYRQRQYIGRLMREVDAESIRATFESIKLRERSYVALHAASERWRSRLLKDGDDAIEEFLSSCPAADRQQLRRLVRQARQAAERGATPAAARALFRYIHEQLVSVH